MFPAIAGASALEALDPLMLPLRLHAPSLLPCSSLDCLHHFVQLVYCPTLMVVVRSVRVCVSCGSFVIVVVKGSGGRG
jgi:hypothetical protein